MLQSKELRIAVRFKHQSEQFFMAQRSIPWFARDGILHGTILCSMVLTIPLV